MAAMLPLAGCYLLSYLLRNVNGTVAGDLVASLELGAGQLGQLTSAYFLAFAAAQIPVGVLLDRFGPGRVQSALLCVAACGAAVCALTSSYAALFLGRALVGVGTAGGLVAGLKASAAWFPRERLPWVNGALIMCGGLGALAATWPVERALRSGLDWHGVYGALAAVALALAASVAALVPRPWHGAAPAARAAGPGTFRDIVSDPKLRRFAPMSALCFGSVLAVQGLWAGPWLADVDRLARPAVADRLAWMAVMLVLAAPCWSALTAWLRPRVSLAPALAGVCVALMLCEAAIVCGLGAGTAVSMLPWCGFACFGGMTVLSFSVIAELAPPELLGRANAALNVLHIGTSFLLQLLFGHVVALWAPMAGGHYPVAAYRAALLAVVALQAAALVWFAWPRPAARTAAATASRRAAPNPELAGAAACEFAEAPR